MCYANRNRLLEQGSNSLFLYDLCQTVYLSPQICIPAGDVDACLSTESSLLRLCIFQTALKNTFLWYYFLTLERAGKDMVSLGGSERIAEEYLIKIFEALFCAITILS